MNDIASRADFRETMRVLRVLYELVNPNRIEWVLTGSTSLILRGIDVPVRNDIDMLTTPDNVKKIDEALAGCRVRSPQHSSTEKYDSCFGQYFIGDVKIDLMGDFRYKLMNGTWSPIRTMRGHGTLEVGEMRLSVFSLERELATYEMMGRRDKVLAIRRHLNASVANDNAASFRYRRPSAFRAAAEFAGAAGRGFAQYPKYAMAAGFSVMLMVLSSAGALNQSHDELIYARAGAAYAAKGSDYADFLAKSISRPKLKTKDKHFCDITDFEE